MEAHQLLKAGKLQDAIFTLQTHLAEAPSDHQAQTFLFELICFTGDFDRAESQLNQLAQEEDHPHSEAGISRYKDVLRAERRRQALFANQQHPRQLVNGGQTAFRGSLNGEEFLSFSDADPRIGDKLEIFSTGEYFWIALSDVRRMKVPAPRRLRDLLWLPVQLHVVASLESPELLHDIWLPMMAPLTWQHPDEEVKLGRVSDWRENQFGDFAPYGLKSYLVDGFDVPLAEIREVVIRPFGLAHTTA